MARSGGVWAPGHEHRSQDTGARPGPIRTRSPQGHHSIRTQLRRAGCTSIATTGKAGSLLASLHYGDPVHWATIITSTGALLGGLAIVIAFIQLGALRQDRLREQVSKLGVWTDAQDIGVGPGHTEWRVGLFIRNGSELPVEVHVTELALDWLGYQAVLASADGEPPQLYADKRTGPPNPPTSSQERSDPGAHGTSTAATVRTANLTPSCGPGSASSR
jgi:hypothetical protein